MLGLNSASRVVVKKRPKAQYLQILARKCRRDVLTRVCVYKLANLCISQKRRDTDTIEGYREVRISPQGQRQPCLASSSATSLTWH